MVTLTDEQKKQLKGAIQEISNSLTRVEAERDLIKDILQDIEDKFELPKKYTRKIAKIYHKQNFKEVQEEQTE